MPHKQQKADIDTPLTQLFGHILMVEQIVRTMHQEHNKVRPFSDDDLAMLGALSEELVKLEEKSQALRKAITKARTSNVPQ